METLKMERYEIRDLGDKSHFFNVALQCKVNPKRIRVPEGFGFKVWMVEDGRDVRVDGILVRKV